MARLAGEVTITKKKFHQRINLASLLGETPTNKQKKIFVNLAIEFIQTRCLDTVDAGRVNFKPYTEAYAERKGVTQDSVDMFLEGDMFDAMGRDKQLEGEDDAIIAVKGQKEITKAFVHQTGEGKQKKRQWFGLTEDDAIAIARQVPKRRRQVRRTTLAELEDALSILTIEQTE